MGHELIKGNRVDWVEGDIDCQVTGYVASNGV